MVSFRAAGRMGNFLFEAASVIRIRKTQWIGVERT
jgi:hypothetical protein